MNDPSPLIAVVGATGHQGSAVVTALLERGAKVRALVRDPSGSRAASLADRGVELVPGDLTDPDSLDAFLKGADAAYAMATMTGPGGTEQETANGVALADAARRTGLPHLLYSSVGGAERQSGVPHFESKRRVEEHIEALGLHATFLRPVFFTDNFQGFGVSTEDGEVVVRMPLPDNIPLQMVAVHDVGRAAAAILAGGTDVEGGAVEIAGDELTGSQIAAAFGEAAGLPARYEALPLEVVESQGDLAAMFRWFGQTSAYQGDFEATRALLGDAPLDLPGWIKASGWTAG
ncbi:NmrA/HSCARG family protein [Arthrobacter sp. zg-Y826]|uniref:NmrA/HSCARG family protein n=1 Tax=Arthrobacter jinronghuae TaxID=2964609 RepID=UPI0021026BBB|nr:NmrA/HSCARG family protein [Arthrobacter jinronghuae]MCQ1956424.1 NmrA/HSCARG family protein [Arthrobacter jinronghuae]